MALADEPPTLFSLQTDDGRWVANRIDTNGATIEVEITAYGARDPVQLGVHVYWTNDDRYVYGSSYTSVAGPRGAYVDLNLPDQDNIHADMTDPEPTSTEPLINHVTINPEGPTPRKGIIKVLMWVAGDVDRVTYEIAGGPGVEHLGHKAGDHTFVYRSQDFSGTATVAAGSGEQVGARAHVETSRTEDIENTLVGSFVRVASSENIMTAEGPNGSRECPCNFRTFNPADSFFGAPATAGRYTFHLTGAGLGGDLSEVVLGGADAQLPEEADLGLESVEATTATVPVGEEAEVAVGASFLNRSSTPPIDAVLDLALDPPDGIALVAAPGSIAAPRLVTGEVRDAEGDFTVRCEEPGSYEVGLTASVRPAHSADIDPQPANNAAVSLVTIICG